MPNGKRLPWRIRCLMGKCYPRREESYEPDSEYLSSLRARYRKASRKERTAILDEYVKTTEIYGVLDLVQLRHQIDDLQSQLLASVSMVTAVAGPGVPYMGVSRPSP